MTALQATVGAPIDRDVASAPPSVGFWALMVRSRRVMIGGGIILLILLICLATLPWTLREGLYQAQNGAVARIAPSIRHPLSWFGYDGLGRSIFVRCLLGGSISLAVGAAAALISVVLGTTVGLIAGYRGGWLDSLLMRSVDVLYGLPYILLVVLFKVGFEGKLTSFFGYFARADASSRRWRRTSSCSSRRSGW
jgi:ABC-type dipeptide/oligopeptide/nickel transport system permease subunit